MTEEDLLLKLRKAIQYVGLLACTPLLQFLNVSNIPVYPENPMQPFIA